MYVTATATAIEAHVIVYVEAQSLIRSGMSPCVLLSTRCLDQLSVNSSSSNNKYKAKRGAIKHFDNNNIMTEDLTTRITETLRGRKSLEYNELKLLECLLKIQPTINRQSVLSDGNVFTEELTTLPADALSGRSSLEANELKLLKCLEAMNPNTTFVTYPKHSPKTYIYSQG